MSSLAELVEQLLCARHKAFPREPAQRSELWQIDILNHGQVGRKACLLHHHRHAGTDCFTPGGEARALPEQANLAAVRQQLSRDDTGEGRFAGAIRADESMDLAGQRLKDRPDNACVHSTAFQTSRASIAGWGRPWRRACPPASRGVNSHEHNGMRP